MVSASHHPNANSTPLPLLFLAVGTEDKGLDWVSAWQRDYPDFHIVAGPINVALNALDHPAIVICRAQACQAIADWSRRNPHRASRYIAAALLVAPAGDLSPRSQQEMEHGLPFLSVVVTSRNGITQTNSEMLELARQWRSIAVDGGMIGMADRQAQIGEWGHGRHVLNWLVDQVSRQLQTYVSGPTGSAGHILPFPPIRDRRSVRPATLKDKRS